MKLFPPVILAASALLSVGARAQSPDWVYDRYIKASNPDADDRFGVSIAISGSTLVIGAPGEDSSANGVNGNQNDDTAADAGAVYVYRLTQAADGSWNWAQTDYLKASNSDADDRFGASVAVDGDIIVVGAPHESSSASVVNGDQANNNAIRSGAAYVFVRSYVLGIEVWSQQAYLKASNCDGAVPGGTNGDLFGTSVAVSGTLVAVGAPGEDGASNYVNGQQGSNAATNAGAAYVFRRSGSSFWYQEAYVKPSVLTAGTSGSFPLPGGEFGRALALSGSRLVAGAPTTEVASLRGAGMAFLFERSTSGTWSEIEAFQSPAPSSGTFYGRAVDLDAARVIVGEPNADGLQIMQGKAHIYRPSSSPLFGGWVLETTLTAPNADADEGFGLSVCIEGDLAVVGAPYEDGASVGLGGNPASNTAPQSGAAYSWRRGGAGWGNVRYLKASNTAASDYFGEAAAVDNGRLVVAATWEDGGVTSGPFAPYDNSAPEAGAVYLFHPLVDCDGNGIDDPSEIAGFDCNGNGVLDRCDVAAGAGDCDGNLVPDTCQGDVNQDGILDACQSGGTGYCFGDGSGVACPCGNSGAAGNGCANSANAQGARLVASGLPFVANDSLRLAGSGMTPTSSVLYFQGTTQGAGTAFGDGLRCATGAIIRLGTTTNAGGASSWPAQGAQPISVRGGIPAAGGVSRTYQAWYRDASATYCLDTARFNLTNGVLVQWLP